MKAPLRSVAVRLFLAGAAQSLFVLLGLFAVATWNRNPLDKLAGGVARLLADSLQEAHGDLPAIRQAVARTHGHLGAVIEVRGAGDERLAWSEGAPEHPCDAGSAMRRTPRFLGCAVVDVDLGALGPGKLACFVAPPPPPAGVQIPLLVVSIAAVAIATWVGFRAVVPPLARLTAAARAFGAGDLGARVRSTRRDELGEVSRAFDAMADRVTELLRAERELLANVSHELRTPLARIRVALDLAAEGDADVARESLGEITADLEELERLIEDVLATARLHLVPDGEPAALPLRRERVALEEIASKAIERFAVGAPARPVRARFAPTRATVDADPSLLRRVIENLLENAHRYTDDRAAPIDVEITTGATHVTCTVSDLGIGIDAADLPHVLRPFFRTDRSRARATGGLGLGLPLASRIVRAHGGELAIASEPGRGTRVTVRLPRAT